MELRTYKWEDLEKIRKFFKLSDTEFAKKIHTSRQRIYNVKHQVYSKESVDAAIQQMGMAIEIFAIYYVNSFLITRSIDVHNSYNLLLDYISYCNAHPNEKRMKFNEWYLNAYPDLSHKILQRIYLENCMSLL